MSPRELTTLGIELGRLQGRVRNGDTLTDAENARMVEIVTAIGHAGVTLKTTTAVRPEGQPPRDSFRGADGIIRSAPGVFEKRFADALAAMPEQRVARASRRPIRRSVARQTRARRRVVRGRAHSSHGPPRRSDPEPLAPPRRRT